MARGAAARLGRVVVAGLTILLALAGLLSLASPHVDLADLVSHLAGDASEGAAELTSRWRRPAPPSGVDADDGPLAWSAPFAEQYAGFGDAELKEAATRCSALPPRGTWRLPLVRDYAAVRDAGLPPDFRADWLAVAVRDKGLVLGGAALLSGEGASGPRRLRVRCVSDAR